MSDRAPDDEASEEVTEHVEAILGDVMERRKRRHLNARMALHVADVIHKLAGADAYKCDSDELSKTLLAAHHALRRILRCCGGVDE